MKKLVPFIVVGLIISGSLTACSKTEPEQAAPMTKQDQNVGINIRVNPEEARPSQEVGVNIQVNGDEQ
ncbi:MAG: hypothetical protein AB7J46_00430 [Candidatus Altimarinota bacterium]